MFPCKDGRASFTPQEGIWKSASQKPLRATGRPQANRRARSPKGKRKPTAAVFFAPRVQKLRRIESGASCGRRRPIRIGSVSRRLGTWAASGGLVTFESLGHRHEGQSKRKTGSSRGVAGEVTRDRCPQAEDSRVAPRSCASVSANSLLVPGRDGSTAVHDRLSGAIRLMYLWVIVRILARSRYAGGARERNLLGKEPLGVEWLLFAPQVIHRTTDLRLQHR